MLTYRRPSALRLFALAFALVAGLAVVLGAMLSAAQAAPVGTLKQFKVPTDNSQPRHITIGSDGNLWFTEGNESSPPAPTQRGRHLPPQRRAGSPRRARSPSSADGIGPPQCFCLLNDIVQGPGRRPVLHHQQPRPGAHHDGRRDPAVRGPGTTRNPITTLSAMASPHR